MPATEEAEADPLIEAAAKPKSNPKRGGLFVTDAEMIRRLGVPEKIGYQTIGALDANPLSGFPPKQKLWGSRRYWPAVLAWLDYQYVPKILGKHVQTLISTGQPRRTPPKVNMYD